MTKIDYTRFHSYPKEILRANIQIYSLSIEPKIEQQNLTNLILTLFYTYTLTKTFLIKLKSVKSFCASITILITNIESEYLQINMATQLLKDFWSIQLTYTMTMGKLCTFLFGVSLTWKTLKYAYWQLIESGKSKEFSAVVFVQNLVYLSFWKILGHSEKCSEQMIRFILKTPVYKYQNCVLIRWQLNKRKGEKALKERNERYRGREEELFGPVDKELEIIACTIEGLRKGMHEGRFTCVQVVKVYARRCYIIGRENCDCFPQIPLILEYIFPY